MSNILIIDDEKAIRNALRDHFVPPFDDWKEMVLFRSDQVYRQALAGLASEPGRS